MKNKKPNRFLEVVSIILIILGSISLASSIATNWAHSLIYDESYYLNIISPLPKNNDVSWAISTFIVSSVFQNNNVEDKIKSFLPPQLDFLSAPLTTEVQNRSLNAANRIIKSDSFSSAWVFANTVFHKRVEAFVTKNSFLSQLTDKAKSLDTKLQFDGSPLAQQVIVRLGAQNPNLMQRVNNLGTVSLDFISQIRTIRDTVFFIIQLSLVLPYITIALFLSGIAFASTRQKGLLITGIFISLSMLVEIILLRIGKTEFLSQFKMEEYVSAVGVVWDSFTQDIIIKAWATFVIGLVIGILAGMFGEYRWAMLFRQKVGIDRLQTSTFGKIILTTRMKAKKYVFWLYIIGTAIFIVSFFIMQQITISTAVISSMLLVSYFSLLPIIF